MRSYGILLIAVLSSSCAGVQSSGAASRDFVFYNPAGTISINENGMQLKNSKSAISLMDCSDSWSKCFSLDNNVISVPKNCPASIVAYYNNDRRFRVVGYVHDVVTVRPVESEDIMFSYSNEFGLTAIYWDYMGSGVLRDRGDGLGVDRVAAQRFVFTPKPGRAVLTCKAS